MIIKISVTNPENVCEIFNFNEQHISVGRSSKSTLSISDENLSRSHFEITFENNQFFIQDLGSINGTFINGERIPANQKIPYSIYFPLMAGKLTFTIEVLEESASPHSFDRVAANKALQNEKKKASRGNDFTTTKTKKLHTPHEDENRWSELKKFFSLNRILALIIIVGVVMTYMYESNKPKEVEETEEFSEDYQE